MNSNGVSTGARGGLAVMARLIWLVAPLSGYMVLAIALGLAGHLAATAITVLGGYGLLDVIGLRAGGVALPTALVAMGACALVRGALRYGEQSCNHFIAFKLLALIRERVFEALRRLAPAKLEGRGRGDLISVITSDIELLEVFYAHTISPAVIALAFCVILLAYLGAMHPLLALVAGLGYATVGLAMPALASRLSGGGGADFRARAGELSSFVLDSLRGLDQIQQFGCGAERLARMNRIDDGLASDERRLKDAMGLATGATNAVILGFDVAMLAAAAALQIRGEIAFAQVVLAQLAFMGSFGPVVALANLGSTLQATFAAGDRVLDILDEGPVCAEVDGRRPVRFDGATAEHVTFSYPAAPASPGSPAAAGDAVRGPDRDGGPVLEDVVLRAAPGEIVGVCGRSGSGKSTLLRLFMRFWDVDSGCVRMGGRDVRDVNTADLRAMESLVAQDTELFSDTIRNNVLVARLDATDEEVEDACRKASIHEFICSLPDGYDTQVGELGDTLSGGERQRLGLARAFLHDAPFMLLDEPTSNLDSLNEGVILRALRDARAGKTVLLVSHRASTMRVADRVVRVERGRVS